MSLWQELQDHTGPAELSGVHLSATDIRYVGDPSLRFPIASCTKSFTARAVEQAGIDLRAPVCELIPDFAMHDKRAGEGITVEDLLCHRSGLPPHTWSWVFAESDDKSYIRDRLPYLQHLGPHDAEYRYSNITYLIAGSLLPDIWERYVQSALLTPLGLENSGFLHADWLTDGVAIPRRNGHPIPPFHAKTRHPIGAASEMISTAADLGRWLSMWLDIDTACFTPRQAMPNGRQYGLGWRIWDDFIYHTGSCSGYTSILALRPDRKQAIALLLAEHGQTDYLLGLARQLLGLRADGLPGELQPVAEQHTTPIGPLDAERDGVWWNPGYGELMIRDGEVYLNRQNTGVLEAATQHWKLSTYNACFPLSWQGQDLQVGLEPKIDPIKFSKRD